MRLYFILFILLCTLSGCVAELGLEVADLTIGTLAKSEETEALVGKMEISAPFTASMGVDGFNITLAEARVIGPIGDDYYIEFKNSAKLRWQLIKDSIRTPNGKSISLNGAEIFETSPYGSSVMSNTSDYNNTIKFQLNGKQPVLVLSSTINGWYAVCTGIGMNRCGYIKVSDNSISPILPDSRIKSANTINSNPCNACGGAGIISRSYPCNVCGGSGTLRYPAPQNLSGTTNVQCWKCLGNRYITVQYFCKSCRGSGHSL